MSILAATATGLILWLSYPPAGMTPAVWVALMPLLAVLWPLKLPDASAPAGPLPAWWLPTRAPGAFLHGYWAGLVFFLPNMWWLHHVTGFGMIMLSLYLALYPAMWALIAATVGRPRHWGSPRELARAIALTAAAWTGLEWLRGIAFTGFGWNGLGVALVSADVNDLENAITSPIAQWAEWIGVTGLSFIITAHAAFWVGIWRIDPHGDAVGRTRRLSIRLAKALVGVTVIGLALGFIGDRRARTIAAATHDAPPLTVTLVQPNIPQEEKNLYASFGHIARTLSRLTQEAFQHDPKPDLVVWPESALPATFYDPEVIAVLEELSQLGDFTHILGIDDQDFDAYYNAVSIFRGDPLQATLHRKVHLVPFGEYLPARGIFGKFEYIRAQLPGDFQPGDSWLPIPLPRGPADSPPHAAPASTAIPLVCFEDTLGRVARRFARPQPQILVNVTNDAWFRDSAGADQHLANALMRTIELRRPMVRAANTGVTAIIDPTGRITHRLPRLETAQLTATIHQPTISHQTLYARFGDAFSIALLALTAASLATATVRRRRKRIS